MKYVWFGIKAEFVDAYRALTSDLVHDAISRLPDWTVDSIYEAAKEKEVQLWLLGPEDGMLDGIVISQIINCPGAKILHILGVAGGNKDRYTPFVYDVLVPFAKSVGCHYMQAYMRDGWLRTPQIKDHGWEKVAVVMRKPLHDTPARIPPQAFATH